MAKRNVVRVKPISFDTDWRADMKAIGVKVPKTVPETRYTPVNHDPMPYSLAVDLTAKRVVRRIVGVMPNALYTGPFYTWAEFCELVGADPAERVEASGKKKVACRATNSEDGYGIITTEREG